MNKALTAVKAVMKLAEDNERLGEKLKEMRAYWQSAQDAICQQKLHIENLEADKAALSLALSSANRQKAQLTSQLQETHRQLCEELQRGSPGYSPMYLARAENITPFAPDAWPSYRIMVKPKQIGMSFQLLYPGEFTDLRIEMYAKEFGHKAGEEVRGLVNAELRRVREESRRYR